jgi:hypothetical protein
MGWLIFILVIVLVTIYFLQERGRHNARKRRVWRAKYLDSNRSLTKSLEYYEFTLHHRLRASLARARGLVQLLLMTERPSERQQIQLYLKKNLDEMDQMVKVISTNLNRDNNARTDSNGMGNQLTETHSIL